jgi:hypothetical protein
VAVYAGLAKNVGHDLHPVITTGVLLDSTTNLIRMAQHYLRPVPGRLQMLK